MDRSPPPPLKAVALRYHGKKDRAPKVAAKGRGYLAERIIEIAKAENIPIREDKNLFALLSRLDLDQEIPPETYKAIAEILAFVYRVAQRRQSSAPPS